MVADVQTAGRGRLGRRWEAPPGTALLASFVLPVHPLAVFAAGVAAAEACGHSVTLKWPNDLLLGDRKLGGVLADARRGRVVAGIGVNLSWAPPGAARLEVDREALLDLLLNGLDRWFATPPEGVLERWRALSSTLGRRVRAELPGGVVEGIATDVDPDGALLVDGARIAAGDVIHLRPVRPGAGAARRTGP